MSFAVLPAIAAWQHQDARAGFEVAFFRIAEDHYLIEGCTAAAEDRTAWVVEYAIELDTSGRTRIARIFGRSDAGPRSRTLEADGRGGWQVDGLPAPGLDGCVDVDLESSAMTNALPVRRMNLPAGTQAAIRIRLRARIRRVRTGQQLSRDCDSRVLSNLGHAGAIERA